MRGERDNSFTKDQSSRSTITRETKAQLKATPAANLALDIARAIIAMLQAAAGSDALGTRNAERNNSMICSRGLR